MWALEPTTTSYCSVEIAKQKCSRCPGAIRVQAQAVNPFPLSCGAQASIFKAPALYTKMSLLFMVPNSEDVVQTGVFWNWRGL
ncbi:hypothetical protein FKM82_028630 [Ascaphus truei]